MSESQAETWGDWPTITLYYRWRDIEDVEIPGLGDGANLEDEQTRRSVLSSIGRRLKRCFGDRDSVQIDQLKIERLESRDENYHRRFDYRFLPLGNPAETPQKRIGGQRVPRD